jgi:hypothetical protein
MPLTGLTVCRMHGANGAAKAAAAVRETERKAILAIRREGVEPVGDPVELLLSLTAEAAEWQRQLREIVAGLSLIRYEDAKGAEQLRSEIALYERALDRTQKFATDLAKLGLEERRTRLDERYGAQIAQVIRGCLIALGVDPEPLAVREVVEAQLMIAGSA